MEWLKIVDAYTTKKNVFLIIYQWMISPITMNSYSLHTHKSFPCHNGAMKIVATKEQNESLYMSGVDTNWRNSERKSEKLEHHLQLNIWQRLRPQMFNWFVN